MNEEQQTIEIKPEDVVVEAAPPLKPYGEIYIPKDPVRITDKNFLKRYRVDNRLKPVREHYNRIVEEKVGAGVNRDRKELIVKQLVYQYVMSYYDTVEKEAVKKVEETKVQEVVQ